MSKTETETKGYRNIRLSMETWENLNNFANELAIKEGTRKISLDYAVDVLLREHASGR